MKSRWLSVLAALLVIASGSASAADAGRSADLRSIGAQSPDIAPLVVTDPRTGAIVRIWIRSDGFTSKVAWARMTPAGWGPAHDLTFGLGIDRDPAVGTTSAGSWLFWRNDRGEVSYAPLDLASGRLLGVPAPLAIGSVGGVSAGPRPGTEGGVDAPVTYAPCPDNPELMCVIIIFPTPPAPPGGPTNPPIMEGGSDAPVTYGSSSGTGSGLVVSSDPNCERQIVTIAQAEGDSLLVIELDGAGYVTSRTMVNLDEGVTQEQAGQYFLLTACEP